MCVEQALSCVQLRVCAFHWKGEARAHAIFGLHIPVARAFPLDDFHASQVLMVQEVAAHVTAIIHVQQRASVLLRHLLAHNCGSMIVCVDMMDSEMYASQHFTS